MDVARKTVAFQLSLGWDFQLGAGGGVATLAQHVLLKEVAGAARAPPGSPQWFLGHPSAPPNCTHYQLCRALPLPTPRIPSLLRLVGPSLPHSAITLQSRIQPGWEQSSQHLLLPLLLRPSSRAYGAQRRNDSHLFVCPSIRLGMFVGENKLRVYSTTSRTY